MGLLSSRLYLRIWLAVVGAVVLISLLVAGVWQLSREERAPPVRELVLRNAAGDVIGQAQSAPDFKPGRPMRFELHTTDGQRLQVELSRPAGPPPGMHGGARPGPGPGPGSWWGRQPLSFVWMMVLVSLAVALGAYPIIRRLTKRLEALQRGVERWGAGELGTRVAVEGGDEVAFLAERFNHAAERIERLLASHKALLANASHELRSPLARIRMGLALMGDDSSTQAHEIRRSLQELDQLIDEILLASRLDAAQGEPEAKELLDLTGLAAEECARVGAELQAAPASAGVGSQGLMLRASPRLLRRLLRNLLENAQRHGAGEVTLALHVVDGQADIRVNDRGPGVPPAERERIFEPFYRLPGASEREGGVGLGLALVKSIAEHHGGLVHCEARPGGGASFVVRLPLG
jgi:two-component system, OmpR family, sensor kinase